MHDVTQPRAELAKENIEMFSSLARQGEGQAVVVATTKWGDGHEKFLRREEQLAGSHWVGSDMVRFLHTTESAWEVINFMLEKDAVDALRVQKELVALLERLPRQKVSTIAPIVAHLILSRRKVDVLALIW